MLRRPRLKIGAAKVGVAMARIQEAGFLVELTIALKVATDPDDKIFLECAAAADAEYLVTGNLAHFPA